jgi:hypothetical protein
MFETWLSPCLPLPCLLYSFTFCLSALSVQNPSSPLRLCVRIARKALPGALTDTWHGIQAQVVGVEEGVSPAVLAAVCAFNEELLSEQINGRSVLVHRIITLLKVINL